ncbi:MAG: thioesterase family protein [Hyphomonas sp.]|uniref:thioesterase family protein n=1 Tax=Hyphomonas sp. TaxID=87 RepID=UPI001B13DDEF|nr:thioesterase family protein [Hyphomonas sp.]MBO6582474.1 thioesterase family protein [Hyphomonas sp.]
MDFTTLMRSGKQTGDHAMSFHVPETWMQGRTTYGGLTAALCLQAAMPTSGGRQIRSAQVAFVGPVSGDVECTATLLREGKNTVFTSVRMMGEAGVAAEAIFAFGAHRESSLNFANLPAPEVTSPDETASFFGESPRRPAFTRNFNMRLANGSPPMSGAPDADMSLWMRHKDGSVPPDAVSVLALADAPPPAAMSMLTGQARISSMTWMAEFLTDDIQTNEGWFLARHVANTSKDGYNSQAMTLWNTSGQPIMIGRQTIAVFA